MHRVVLVTLWLLIVTVFCEGAVFFGDCFEDATYHTKAKWKFDELTGELIISGTGRIEGYSNGVCLWENFGDKIKSVVIMDGIEDVGQLFFCKCTSLETVIIADSVVSFWDEIFPETETLKLHEEDGGLYLGNPGNPYHLFVKPVKEVKESMESFVLKEGTKIILGGAFMGCKKLKKVSIPSTVTCVGWKAFEGCPNDLFNKAPGDDVLLYLGNDDNPYHVFYSANEDKTIETAKVHDDTVVLANYAFRSCKKLEFVTFGRSNYFIGSHLFNDRDKNLKKTVTLTSNRAVQIYKTHYPASDIKALVLAGVKDIPNKGFSDDGTWWWFGYMPNFCQYLNSVTLTDSVVSIGIDVFDRCDKLAYTTYRGGHYLGTEDNPFYALIKAKDKSISSLKIHGKTKIIAGGAFSGCNSLETVTIPESVTFIGNSAFSNCNSLTTVNIQAQASISENAFLGCSSLKTITIGNGVKSLGNNVFKSCTTLESITISDSVSSIGDESFEFCKNLKSVSFGSNVESIGMSAFEYCSNMKSVTIPKSVSTIKHGAFAHCSTLEKVSYLGTSDPGKYSKAFHGCKQLENIEVPKEYTDTSFCGKKISTSATLLNKPKWLMTLVALFAFVLLFP